MSATAERFVYFDCASGASAEMLLGGLVSAGLLAADLRDLLAPLREAGAAFDLRIGEVSKGPVHATLVEIVDEGGPAGMRLEEMTGLLERAGLAAPVLDRAVAILERLTAVAARLAGERPADLVLPQPEATEALVGGAGVCAALAWLEVGTVFCSPVNLGRADPVAAAILAAAPTYDEAGPSLVTPAAAAILAELAAEWAASPPFAGASIGYGAGVRDLPRPNVVRTFVGYGTIAGGN